MKPAFHLRPCGGLVATGALNCHLLSSPCTSPHFPPTELKPKGADDKVWNSLFTSSTVGSGGNDYMIRSAMRRVA